jgi:hypothetical protein
MYPRAPAALSIIGDYYETAMRATGYDEMAMREGRAMPALREPLLAAWLAQLLSAGAARVAAAPRSSRRPWCCVRSADDGHGELVGPEET